MGYLVLLAFAITPLLTLAPSRLQAQSDPPVYTILLRDLPPLTGRILSQDSAWIEVWPSDDDEASFVPRDRVLGMREVPRRENMLTTNYLMLLGVLPLTYYHRASDHLALGLGLRAIVQGIGFRFGGDGPGYGALAEARYYTAGNALHGFYWAPNISYYDLPQDSPIRSRSRHVVPGILIGWQWFPAYHLPIGFSIGVDAWYNLDWQTATRNDYHFRYRALLLPAFRFDAGYAW
jgi:hypothetical protein